MEMPPKPPPVRLFDASSGDVGYLAARDHSTKPDVPRDIEAAWDETWHLCPEGPQNFASEFRNNFHERVWELYLMAVLSRAGLNLEKAPAFGPDIRVRLASGSSCWIEAIAVTAGDGPDAVWQPPRGIPSGGGSGPKEEQVLLRYRSALEDKFRKYEKYIAKGVVTPSDMCLIAVYTGQIRQADLLDTETPAMLRAVLPIGNTVLNVIPYSKKRPKVSVERRVQILKRNKSPVDTMFLLDPRTAFVSGIIFVRNSIYNLSWKESKLHLIHRPGATVPVPLGMIPTRCEMWADQKGTIRHRGICSSYGHYSKDTCWNRLTARLHRR